MRIASSPRQKRFELCDEAVGFEEAHVVGVVEGELKTLVSGSANYREAHSRYSSKYRRSFHTSTSQASPMRANSSRVV